MIKIRQAQITGMMALIEEEKTLQICDAVSTIIEKRCPFAPETFRATTVRIFLLNLGSYGISDLQALHDLTIKYFEAGASMTTTIFSTRWRQILLNRTFSEPAKVAELSKLLDVALVS